MEKLSGKTALVTGSTDGVGGLVARKLGEAGARVLVHDRDAQRGTRVVAEIEASGGAATFRSACGCPGAIALSRVDLCEVRVENKHDRYAPP